VQLTPYGCDMLREARANASASLRGLLDGWSEDRRLRLCQVLQELDDAASEFIRQPHANQERSS
jgi:DNA-binding MarR family transcriptional regulator